MIERELRKRIPLEARAAEEMEVAGVPEDAPGLNARLRREGHTVFGGVSVRDGRLLITLRVPAQDRPSLAAGAPRPATGRKGRPALPGGPDDAEALSGRRRAAVAVREALRPHVRSGTPGEPPGGAERRARA